MNNENQETVGATIEKSSVVGNAVEMREALEDLVYCKEKEDEKESEVNK